MPISKHCHVQILKQYHPRWIPQGMFNLGIKLSPELPEIAVKVFKKPFGEDKCY